MEKSGKNQRERGEEMRGVSSQTTLIELCQKLRDNEFSWPRRGKLGGWKKWNPPRLAAWFFCATNLTGFNKKLL